MSKWLAKRTGVLFMFLFLALLLLSACDATNSESNNDGDPNGNDANDELENDEENIASDEGPEPLESEEEMKIGYPTTGGSMLPLWVAKDLGFFEKYGIDAELVHVSGTPKVQELLDGGSLDAGLLGVDSVGKSKAAGRDSVIFASVADKVAMYVYGTDDLDADALENDFKGETIITAEEGSLYDYLAEEFVETAGLSDDEVDYLNMGGGDGDRTGAFVNGEGKAIVISPPTSFKLDEMGHEKIFDFTELDVLMSGLGVTEDFYEENPDVAEALVGALVEANNAILTNEEETLEVLKDWTEIDDEEMAEKTYEEHLPTIPETPVVSDESIEFFLKRSDSEEVRDMEPDDLVDDSIAEELEDEGWVESVME